MMGKKLKAGTFIGGIIYTLFSVLYICPVILTIMNAFKKSSEFSKPFYFPPEQWKLDNFFEAFNTAHMNIAFYNSFLVTVISVFSIVLIASMASYAIARNNNYLEQLLYFLFISGLVIPFHVIMIPSMKIVGMLKLNGRIGLIIIYVSLGMSLAVFLFTGFIRSAVPMELEEAAFIDGASQLKVFFNVVVPLIAPVIVTVVMLDTIWVWNDFLLPSILLTRQNMLTLPLSQFRFVSQYVQKWNLQFAAFTMGLIPLFILFFTCQKYIVKGVASGSLKG